MHSGYRVYNESLVANIQFLLLKRTAESLAEAAHNEFDIWLEFNVHVFKN